MKNTIFPLTNEFRVNINPISSPKNLSEATRKHIEELWKKELIRTKGRIFNGKLLSADEWTGNQLTGHFVEYKHYVAQARDPALINVLNIAPICVCSYSVADNHILIGKRSDHVTDYQNCFELVPSGGIDPSAVQQDSINFIKQFELELKEEAGLDPSFVKHITPSFLILYQETNSYEICAKIELDPSAITARVARDEEYSELMWIQKSRMPEFIKKHHQQFNPLSIQILSLFP